MFACKRILVEGIVQGVGFRPFIYKLANQFDLKGIIYNDSKGVYIEVEGDKINVDNFINSISHSAPPLALIENVKSEKNEKKGYDTFSIAPSEEKEDKFILISPDVSTCDDCLVELNNSDDRRFEYPFINCTNCGPRFTIIKNIPYDRPKTTMGKFKQCTDCESEYQNPTNRRFHAQPNACHVCGPHVSLYDNRQNPIQCTNPIDETVKLLRDGFIIALKGLGGYHLACDALNEKVVDKLRERKFRIDKPFAVMIPDVRLLDNICIYTEKEKEFLSTIQRPIVLIKRKSNSPVVRNIAPGNNYLGIMLPYTPLHHIIMKKINSPLVMTSGNISEEPIAYKDADAFERLQNIADYFLIHNREIHLRCDDSVGTVFNGMKTMLRRSRGYVPYPINIPVKTDKHILATGAHLKNTFCFLRDNYAFISHHIGDLENFETLKSFTEGIEHFKKLFYLNPSIIAYDMHPEYLSTKYALDSAIEMKIPVQHHHAHIASCMIENNITGQVIGVSFDGTGYGTDGNIWGGEFFTANFTDFNRIAHFEYIPLPGGEAAIREPWRIIVSNLYHYLGNELDKVDIPFLEELQNKYGMNLNLIKQIIDKKINSPLTSAAGRLFDAVSALCRIRYRVNYEAQAAIEFQMLADENERRSYSYDIDTKTSPWKISFDSTFREIITDIKNKIHVSKISGKFHNTIAEIISSTAEKIRLKTGLNKIALSGGVFQNALLIEKVIPILNCAKFEVYTNSKIPPNDGGISLGQAVIAQSIINKNKT